MAKKILLKPRDSVARLERVVASCDNEEQKTRIRVMLALKAGGKQKEVAKRFVIHRETVGNWVRAYNTGGVDALKMSKGGRPEGNPKWDGKMFEALTKEVKKGTQYWSVPLMREWILKNFMVEIPENTVWYRMRDLGFSHKSARPHPYLGDTKRQAAFKKGA
ncbi:transposase [Patescibacteria group bacterium]|nr:MAG: transposase [Patescibacteria group bacterium]